MGTARNFTVKTGLDVDDGDLTLVNGNLLVNSGYIDIDNIKIDGQTISTVTGNEAINITPHGTGSVVISKVDINAGTIDGATIATSDVTVGSGKTLDVSAGTLTLAADQISGNAVTGGTIGSITITALAGDLSLGDNSITNVGGIALDQITADGTTITLKPDDNQAAALTITDAGSSVFMKVDTTDSAPLVTFPQDVVITGTTPKLTIGDNGAEDTLLIFDGAEIEYRLGIDDSANQFEIGLGDAHDTTAVIVMDNAGHIIQLGQASPSNGQVLAWDNSNGRWAPTNAGAGENNQTLTTGDGISGANSGSTGNFTIAVEAAQTTITSLLATDIKIGEDDQTKIDFETADEIHFYAANAEQVYVADGVFGPQTDSDVDLGTTSVRWKNAFVDTLTTTDDVAVGDDMTLLSDNAILGFGADTDVTLTHIPDTGIRLNTSMALQFRDSALSIGSTANGQLDIQADATVAITAPDVLVSSTATSKPLFTIKNTHDGTTAGELRFVSDDGAAGADGDDIGTISFYADDSGQNQTAFASIVAEVSESADTDEAGKLTFFIAESDGTNTAQTAALILEGEHATDGQVDVTIGAGAASTTTIVGDLVVNGSTTTISTAQLTVEDSLITVAKGNDSLANADGAGIEIECTGATNPVFIYNNASTAWRSNVDIDTSGTGNTYKINGTEVLNATTLGSAVVSSSLTSTGALNGGSITSGFGTIDTGSSTITTTGLISGGSLDIDDVLINGTTIGHTDDTDLITLADGLVTVAGEISVTTLDIGGTNVTSTAAELNLVDGITAGTVSASKAVIVDSSKDVTGFRNVTGTGALQGATLSVDAVAILDTASGDSATITGETNLFSIPKATYKAAKILYHIKKDDNNRTDAGEILVTHDGTNAFLTHYGQVNTDTNAVVGTWDCTVNSANIEVRFTPTANGAHSYCLVATQLIVEP